jgi:hypothetical protein
VNRIDKLSLALGVYLVVFLWSGSSLITDDVQSFSFVVDLVFTVGSPVMAVWTLMGINRRSETTSTAHIDTEGVYAALKCSDCGGHLVYIENDHDLSRLASMRDSHECPATSEQEVQS